MLLKLLIVYYFLKNTKEYIEEAYIISAGHWINRILTIQFWKPNQNLEHSRKTQKIKAETKIKTSCTKQNQVSIKNHDFVGTNF